eukprot:m.221466 g.221466  ORF g.221466 m.221466 type:complete len:301 (-) comp10807_c2_seq5:7016-7918(-)
MQGAPSGGGEGGDGPPVFRPKIPQRRRKPTASEGAPLPSEPRRERGRGRGRGRGTGRGRGRGRGRGQQLVESEGGIFSQGAAPLPRGPTRSRVSSVGGGSGGASAGSRTSAATAAAAVRRLPADAAMVDEDEDVKDPALTSATSVAEYFSGTQLRDRPVPLSLQEGVAMHEAGQTSQKAPSTSFFSSDNPGDQFGVLQLPDVLPFGPSMTKSEPQAENANNNCSLAHLGDGKIGKLRIRRSGRIELVVGDNVMVVSPSTSCEFLQELVQVDTTTTRSITQLGDVVHRFVVTPDCQQLLGS